MIKRLAIFVTIFIPLGSEFHKFIVQDEIDQHNCMWFGRQVIAQTRGLICPEWYMDKERQGIVYNCREASKERPQEINKSMKVK